MKKRYNLTVIGYYTSHDTTYQTSIECDGMYYSDSGCYEFWVNKDNGHESVAYYPTRYTLITSIERLEY